MSENERTEFARGGMAVGLDMRRFTLRAPALGVDPFRLGRQVDEEEEAAMTGLTSSGLLVLCAVTSLPLGSGFVRDVRDEEELGL